MLVPAASAACAEARTARPADRAARVRAEILVGKGTFERRVLLSGEVDAVSAVELKVPRIPAGRATIRWLENDGTVVKAGQKVAELDNATFVAQMRDQALRVSQSEMDLKRQQWQNGLQETDRVLDVERKRAAVERARIDADVPEGILPKREYLEKQIVFGRARGELQKAEEALRSHRSTAGVDVTLKRLALDKARRELVDLEHLSDALVLRTPKGGTIVVGDHPWEGRKLHVGDDVWLGRTVARLPDPNQLRIRAWLADVDDGAIQVGMPAEIMLDAFADRRLSGRVLEIAPAAREITDRSPRRVFQVLVTLDDKAVAGLRPGASARVEIVAERRPDSVLVPRSAVEMGTGVVHFLSGERRPITLGRCNGQECFVTAGVEPGARLRSVIR